MRKAAILFFLLILISCGGGGDDADPTKPQAKFDITSVVKTMTSYDRPSLIITVENTGEATGYNVSCDAHARNATGTIIDTASAFFAGLGNIAVGETALNEAVFFSLKSHNDYVTLTYDCSWLTM